MSSAPKKQGANFDPKLFSRKKIELPLSSYENVKTGTANLPPQIANFMSRVRNASVDNSDGSVRSEVSASGKAASGKPPSKAESSGLGGEGGGIGHGTSMPREEEAVRRRQGRTSEEGTSVYDSLSKPEDAKPSSSGKGETSKAVPGSAGDFATGERLTVGLGDYKEEWLLPPNPPKSPRHSDSNLPDPTPNGSSSLCPQSPNDATASVVKAPPSPTHPSLQQLPTSSKAHAKAASLPRGQVGDFRHFSSHQQQQQHQSESMSSSHGSTPHVQSDMVAPMYPRERGQYHGERQSSQSQQQQRWPGGKPTDAMDPLEQVSTKSLLLEELVSIIMYIANTLPHSLKLIFGDTVEQVKSTRKAILGPRPLAVIE